MSQVPEELPTDLSGAYAEIKRLQNENRRLKAILSAFNVKLGSAVQPPSQRTPETESSPEPVTRRGDRRNNLTATDRIEIFRSLFQGREDVYAVRWESQKGKSGYSPACAYEWDPERCNKPKRKCEHCQYLPLTDDVLRAHLTGQKTIGIYPLLLDETCWFLAADFDKEGWKEDAAVFLEVCRETGVAAYLERSRSGAGGHVWIFFDEPVRASLARKLGSTLLTEAMERRHQVGLASYDRLFPNQDTLPAGGFGNLIAMPLQRGPRQLGNSEFLDDDFEPHADQWAFLKTVTRVPAATVLQVVQEAERGNLVVGVRMPVVDETHETDPWTLPPSRKRAAPAVAGPLPERLSVVRSNLLYLDKSELTPSLTNRIIRLAAFQNPAFYAAQAMRLSTFGKPRIIGCAEEYPRHIALPRGCLPELESLAGSLDIALDVHDERIPGTAIDAKFHGDLSAEQRKTANTLLKHDDGVLVAPPGFGKTVLAAWTIARRGVNTLVLVHRTALLEQWRQQLSTFLGLDQKEIGTIHGGQQKLTGQLDIAMLQSLQRKGAVADLVAQYGAVIVDECHHLSAFTFERIMKEVKAKYVLGLTATPIRKDGHHPIIFMQCGPLRHRISAKRAADTRPFSHLVLPRMTTSTMIGPAPTIHDVYARLVGDAVRNTQIVDDVVAAVSRGRTPLILTERVRHLDTLHHLLTDRLANVAVLKGGMKSVDKNAVLAALRGRGGEKPDVLIATGRYIGEGFDHSALDTLFLAMPISWRGTLEQYAGRLHRLHDGKREVLVYDYVDQQIPMLARMYAKRVRGYKTMGYTIKECAEQLELPPK